MIEVVAKFPDRTVFLAGEMVECAVTFTNLASGHLRNGSNHQQSSSGKVRTGRVAWASAQIHCQCSVSDARVTISADPANSNIQSVKTSASQTSFAPFQGEKGSTVLSTKPVILFCDLSLLPGESQTYTYREVIPTEAPPSYRGSALKYSYKVTIGAQRLGCPTKLLRLPFRVLVVPGLMDVSVYSRGDEGEMAGGGGELSPTNPFKQRPTNESSILDIAMENLQTITCRKGPGFYNITNSQGKVARFCLFKSSYRLGDDVVGTCDFTGSNVNCVQFSVTLQCEEQIVESYRRRSDETGTTVTTYYKHDEFCLNTSITNISISIPLTATPAFSTELVTVRWRLHFEFITSKTPLQAPPQPTDSDQSETWQGPAHLDVETMVWDLPIKVFATNPVFVSNVSLLKSHSSCVI